jgi:membrane associated rhomboid family serine protease
MIPIRDTTVTRNRPIVNSTLIALNVLVYLIQLAQGPNAARFVFTWGLVPVRYTVPEVAAYFTPAEQLLALGTFMFLHGGFWHLLGNMWSLYIFGDNVEDRLGPIRYLVFYLLCGVASGLAHLVLNAHSQVPTIGASGAIAGVMGAYFLLHPQAKILTLIPIFFIPWFVEIPAFFFLGFWFLLQFLNAAGSHGAGSGIAWWAHIGGFISGMVFLKLALMLPAAGITAQLRKLTGKKKTHRLQVIRPAGITSEPHLYGTITITPYEALTGTRKLINLRQGFQRRMLRVLVPPGIGQGHTLRLRGLGKTLPDGHRGDLYLKVAVG